MSYGKEQYENKKRFNYSENLKNLEEAAKLNRSLFFAQYTRCKIQ